jgi:hypothetical protein
VHQIIIIQKQDYLPQSLGNTMISRGSWPVAHTVENNSQATLFQICLKPFQNLGSGCDTVVVNYNYFSPSGQGG